MLVVSPSGRAEHLRGPIRREGIAVFKAVVAAVTPMSLSSVAFTNVGGSSSRFYNTHTYVVDPTGGPAKIMRKRGGGRPINQMGVRFTLTNRMLYR
jgi:hypothetical protein